MMIFPCVPVVIARKLTRHHHQLVLVKGQMEGFALVGHNAGPDDMGMLAATWSAQNTRNSLRELLIGC